MARTVCEVLDSVLAPHVSRRVYERALEIACRTTVPEEAERTRDFAEGPLLEAVKAIAGLEAAEAVMEGLDPILVMAGSQVREKDEGDPRLVSTQPPPMKRPEPTPVLMATVDRTGIEAIGRKLVGRAVVRQVADVFDLVNAVDARSGEPLVLVIDCCVPAIDPSTVATMLPVLPEGMRVVLWGASERMREELEPLTDAASDWISCAPNADHDDLATLLLSLT